jgi:hypothetical protein
MVSQGSLPRQWSWTVGLPGSRLSCMTTTRVPHRPGWRYFRTAARLLPRRAPGATVKTYGSRFTLILAY